MLEIEALYRTYARDIYHYLLHLTQDAHWAEDLLSETITRALLSLHTFRGQSTEKTWLFGIARNTYLESLRASRREKDKLAWYLEQGQPTQDEQLLASLEQLMQQRDDRSR